MKYLKCESKLDISMAYKVLNVQELQGIKR